MKKWLYFIFPIIGLVVFLFFYFAHVDEAKKAQAIRLEQIAKKDAEAAAAKAALEAKAREDAEARAAERKAADEKKARDKQEKWDSEGQKVLDETNRAKAASAAAAKDIARLDLDLLAIRKLRDQTNEEYLQLLKKVETAKIARRNAELEIQRMTAMIANRTSESALAEPPALPARK